MSKVTKTFVFSFAIFVLAAVVYIWCLTPLTTRAQNLVKEIKTKQTKLDDIKAKVNALANFEIALQEAREMEQSLDYTVPAQLILSDVYSQVDSLAGQSGLKVKRISVEKSFSNFQNDAHLKYIPISIEGTAYFPQMVNFLDLLSSSTIYLQVEKFDIRSNSKGSKPRFSFKITINAFEYSSDAV